MLKLDNRVGSGDLAVYFQKWRTPLNLCRLEYGDAAFDGNGPEGSTIPVAVEIKRLRDALNCMTGGRFAGHQLPGLLANYRRVWLVIEGIYSTDMDTGMLMERRGKRLVPVALGAQQFMYRDFNHWLLTMEVKAGVRVRRTSSRLETARFIQSLYSWWTVKTWEEHRSHLAFEDDADSEILIRPNLARRVAAQLPGIGWHKSKNVARRFPTVTEMVCATERDWLEVEGIGKGLARKITQALESNT